MRGGTVIAVGTSTETSIAADGWFAVCALVAGVVVALVAVALLPRHRLGVLLGLVVGGVGGSVVAWRLGHLLGPGSVEDSAATLADGARFQGPLDLSALGVLLAWSLAASIAFFAAAAGRDPDPLADRRGEALLPPAEDLSPSGGSRPSAQP